MKEGDRVRVKRPHLQYDGAEGTLIAIDRTYCPPCVVILDSLTDKIPEIGMRFFYEKDLEKI